MTSLIAVWSSFSSSLESSNKLLHNHQRSQIVQNTGISTNPSLELRLCKMKHPVKSAKTIELIGHMITYFQNPENISTYYKLLHLLKKPHQLMSFSAEMMSSEFPLFSDYRQQVAKRNDQTSVSVCEEASIIQIASGQLSLTMSSISLHYLNYGE